MDQQHCQLPWNGTQSKFSNPLKKKIIGVKEHGYGVHLFPAIDTVRKGANLMIYIIDKVIEDWKERHGGVYPTKNYLQVDATVVRKMLTSKCMNYIIICSNNCYI